MHSYTWKLTNTWHDKLLPKKLLCKQMHWVCSSSAQPAWHSTLWLLFLTQARSRAVIADRYPSLKLADELATIAFYLNHQQEVKAGGRQRQQQALAPLVRKLNQPKFNPLFLRDRFPSYDDRTPRTLATASDTITPANTKSNRALV